MAEMHDLDGPNPDSASDMAEFIAMLGDLRIRCGSPSYRTLAMRIGPLLKPPRTLSHVTVTDLFDPGRRRLDQDLVVAAVRALGLAEAEVDRWRQACIRMHRAAKVGGPAGVFRQLPPDLATFTGRSEVLAALLEAASVPVGDRARTVVVSAIEGMGGVGKTRLAVHAAHELVRASRFTDIQLFVNLRGFDPELPPADPSEVLDSFLRALQVPAQHIPAGLDDRSALFRDRMHGRSALVVLDNAASEEQVRPLIPATPDCLVLITSRRSLVALDDAVIHQLDVFSADEGLELLRRIVGTERVEAEAEAAESIVEFCGNLPLAVSLVAAQLRSRRAWSMAYLLERLRTGRSAVGGAGSRNLQAAFDLSYRGIQDDVRNVFRLLGVHLGREYTPKSTAALTGLSEADADRALELLCDEHLLEQRSAGRYQFHDLIHGYAADLAATEDSPEDRQRAQRRLVVWYLHSAVAAMDLIAPRRRPVPLNPAADPGPRIDFDDSGAAYAWCDAERGALVGAVTLAHALGVDDVAWQIAATLQYYFDDRCLTEDFITSHIIGVDSAHRACSAEGEARMLLGLSSAYRLADRFAEAVYAGERLLAISVRAGDRPSEVAAVSAIALVHSDRGDHEQAVGWMVRQVELAREMANTHSLASSLNNLGRSYGALRRFDEAHSCISEAIELNAEIGADDWLGRAIDSRGELFADQGHHLDAIECFNRAIHVFRENGNALLEAESLCHLGECYLVVGHAQEARNALSQAYDIYARMDHPFAAQLGARLASDL